MDRKHIRILVVEDHPRVREALCTGLTEHGYICDGVATVAEALTGVRRTPPFLVVLDLGLPDADGGVLLSVLRAEYPDVRCLILSARDTMADRIAGLSGGADDYMNKPFVLAELLARVDAQVRRGQGGDVGIRAGTVRVDVDQRRILVADAEVIVTPKEFDLCRLLVAHAGEVLGRDFIVERVWPGTSFRASMNNVVDVHVSRLRTKLREAGADVQIETARGVGFRLVIGS